MAAKPKTLQSRRSRLVFDYLIEALQTGVFLEGDRLPGERELSDHLDVGRSSVREALSALSALGILNRRVGDGTYVQSRDVWLLIRASGITHDGASLRAVFELQRILEVGVAELATQLITPEGLDRAETAIAEMTDAARRDDIERYFEADRRFHLALAQATDNTLLEQAVCQLMDQMNRPLWRAVKSYFIRFRTEYLERSLEGHERLLSALKSQDHALARAVMEAHFDRIAGEIFGAD